jgi:Arc/MetJ family transcription regulator
MRTNIVIDDKLIKEAFKYSSAKTKKDLIAEALKMFIEEHKRKDLSELRGKILFRENYDYKKLRRGD